MEGLSSQLEICMFMFTRLKTRLAVCVVSVAAVLTAVAPLVEAQLPAVLPYGARLQFAGIVTPSKVSRDAAGNIYALVPATPAIYEIPVNGPIQVVVPSTDPSITGLAGIVMMTVDAAGNIYVTKGTNGAASLGITKIPRLANGTYNYAGETTTTGLGAAAIANGYYSPVDLAVDNIGNIYVAAQAGNTVGAYTGIGILMIGPSAPAGKVLYAATVAPNSIAVDTAGDVFYADKTKAWEIPAAMVQGDTAITPIQIGASSASVCSGCSAVTTPGTIFLDAAGDVYIGNGSTFYLMPNLGTTFSTSSPTYALPNGVVKSSFDYGAVNNNGDLFLHYGGSLEFYGAGKFYVGATSIANPITVGTVSATSYASPSAAFFFTQSVTLASIGTTPAPYAIVNYGSANGSTGPAQTSLNTGSGSTTCTAGATYTAGQSCTVEIGYSPKDPGSFSGALVLYSSTGTILASLDMTSLATGSALTIDTGALTPIGTGYLAPAGIAIDTTGATYVADPASNTVLKFAAGSTAAGTSVGTGLSEPSGVAIDQAGNLYIGDTGNDRIVVIPNYQSGLSPTNQFTLATPGYALTSPRGVAVDSFGNIFISDTGNARVLEVANPYEGGFGTVPTVVASGLNAPYGVALDPYNNLFVADKGANAVYEVPGAMLTSATSNVGSGGLITVSSGFSAPTGVATDGSGSVYIADSGNKRIVKVPSESGVLTPADQVVLYSNLNRPYGIATDLTADIYYTDQAAPSAVFVKRSAPSGSTATTIPFGSVATGSTGTQTVVASNAGLTTPVTFAATAVSTPATPFAQTSTTCPNSGTLAPGKNCTVALTYSPTAAGASTGSFTFTDNALAVTTATQNVSLTGFGSGTVASAGMTGPATAVYGDDVTFTVTARDASGNVAVAMNGPYTVSITGTATSSASVTLTNGVGSFFLPSLGVGSYNLSVTVGGFAATAAITLTKAPLYLTANNISRPFDVASPVLSTSYSGFANGDTASVVSGTAPIVFTPATRVSPYGNYPITFSGGSLTAANYTITMVAGNLSVTGSVPQTIIFPALPNFTHGTTVTLTGQSTSGLPVTYTVTGGSVNGSVLTIGAAGTVTVTATQYGNSTYAAASSVTRSFTAQ
jgi:sugar lactone lactonase YvrE